MPHGKGTYGDQVGRPPKRKEAIKAKTKRIMKKAGKKNKLVPRAVGSPLLLISKYKKVSQDPTKKVKQFGTSLEKERAKKARIEHRTKRVKEKGAKTSKKKLGKIFGSQFERSYERRGTKGKTYGRKAGGMVAKRGY